MHAVKAVVLIVNYINQLNKALANIITVISLAKKSDWKADLIKSFEGLYVSCLC